MLVCKNPRAAWLLGYRRVLRSEFYLRAVDFARPSFFAACGLDMPCPTKAKNRDFFGVFHSWRTRPILLLWLLEIQKSSEIAHRLDPCRAHELLTTVRTVP